MFYSNFDTIKYNTTTSIDAVFNTETWFSQLFGFVESQVNFDQIKENFVVQNVDAGNNVTLLSKCNNRSFHVGNFTTPSLKTLHDSVGNISQSGKILKITHIITKDILSEHSRNPGALFQVASQFNCLEMMNPRNTPELGITIYEYDNTQGPSCALACASSTLYRNYLVSFQDGSNNQYIGQTKNVQINNFDEVEKVLGVPYFCYENGYIFSTKNDLTALNLIIDQYQDQIMDVLKFGVTFNTEVSFTKCFVEPNEKILVSQIFCSAISCSYSGIPNTYWELLARLVLKSCYKATLLAAILNHRNGGSNKVFLTFIGGGAFGNKLEWITDAINYATDSVRNADLDIYICHYGRYNDAAISQIFTR